MSSQILIKMFVLVFPALFGFLGNAQSLPPTDGLYREIVRMDSVLFTAFNNRDVKTFGDVLATDLEFYHDKGGLTDRAYSVESLKRTAAQANGLRRELVPESLEVYPVKDYGAVQIAAHTFCHTEAGKQDCGTFKFVHLWRRTKEGWKLARVISYGH